MQTVMESGGELAQIFLKDGKHLFGILLNDLDCPESFDQEVRYVKTANFSSWLETSDDSLVEVVDPEHIDGIDLFLK